MRIFEEKIVCIMKGSLFAVSANGRRELLFSAVCPHSQSGNDPSQLFQNAMVKADHYCSQPAGSHARI
jgi:hypothetical protein